MDIIIGIASLAVAIVGPPAIRRWFKALVLRQARAATFADHSGMPLAWVPESIEVEPGATVQTALPPAPPQPQATASGQDVKARSEVTPLGCITGLLGLGAWYAFWMTYYPYVALLVYAIAGQQATAWSDWIGIVSLLWGAGFLAGGVANFHVLPKRTVLRIACAYLVMIALGWFLYHSGWAESARDRLSAKQRAAMGFKP